MLFQYKDWDHHQQCMTDIINSAWFSNHALLESSTVHDWNVNSAWLKCQQCMIGKSCTEKWGLSHRNDEWCFMINKQYFKINEPRFMINEPRFMIDEWCLMINEWCFTFNMSDVSWSISNILWSINNVSQSMSDVS